MLRLEVYLFNMGFSSGIEVNYVLVVYSGLHIADVIWVNYCILTCFPLF